MSGTQENNSPATNLQNTQQIGQAGFDQETLENEVQETEEKLSASQKMDNLLRGTSSGQMKREIEKLRKESAKYRIASKTEASQKLAIEQKAKEIQKELSELKEKNRNLFIMRHLDKAGCIKSDLVAKDVPSNCEDINTFIETYKEQNKFLFKTQKQTFGSTFKASGAKNITASQQMDAYIRAALGR